MKPLIQDLPQAQQRRIIMAAFSDLQAGQALTLPDVQTRIFNSADVLAANVALKEILTRLVESDHLRVTGDPLVPGGLRYSNGAFAHYRRVVPIFSGIPKHLVEARTGDVLAYCVTEFLARMVVAALNK